MRDFCNSARSGRSDKVMAYPDPAKKFHLVVDAATGDANAEGGLGACLILKLNKKN